MVSIAVNRTTLRKVNLSRSSAGRSCWVARRRLANAELIQRKSMEARAGVSRRKVLLSQRRGNRIEPTPKKLSVAFAVCAPAARAHMLPPLMHRAFLPAGKGRTVPITFVVPRRGSSARQALDGRSCCPS